jgi:flagellar motor switch protein FliG
VPDQPNLNAHIATLEEIARTTVSALSRIEENQARFDASQSRLEANQTEMRVAIMERIERLEDNLTTMIDQVAVHSTATELVRRTHDEQRDQL